MNLKTKIVFMPSFYLVSRQIRQENGQYGIKTSKFNFFKSANIGIPKDKTVDDRLMLSPNYDKQNNLFSVDLTCWLKVVSKDFFFDN